MFKIRAKVRVNNVQPWNDYQGKQSGEQVTMNPVYSEDKTSENYSFSQATPSGQIQLSITNTAAIGAFPLGAEFYVDFTPVEPSTSQVGYLGNVNGVGADPDTV